MNKFLFYIIVIVTAGLMFGVYTLIKHKKEDKVSLVHKLVAYVIFVLMFVWLLLAFDNPTRLSSITFLVKNTPFSQLENPLFGVKGSSAIALLTFWAFIILHIIALVSPFFSFKVIKRMELFVAPVLALFCLIFLPTLIFGMGSSLELKAYSILFCIEFGLLIGKLVYIWLFERIDFKMDKHDIIEFILCILGAILFTMPEFIPKAFLGTPKGNGGGVIDFGTYHRYYIYLTFIFLIGMVFILRNHKGEYARMILMFICFGGMISFSIGYTFEIFTKPYDWPFHICNTAMFILPISLCTKSEKIFYFTFFVNILGAMLATFMPVYAATEHYLGTRVVGFFINHIEAMAVPLICVLTGVFPRPKKRQFFYSMVGFAVYFVMALILNTIFTAYNHEVDFFFINSTFVAEKIHAEKVFLDFKFAFKINGRQFAIYPLYQSLYFAGFILLSIGMWYVYLFIFKFQDYCVHLNERSKQMKLDALALTAKCNQKEVSKCMNEESKGKLVISHFGKRYSNKTPFAVRDINFEAHEGEIIGFLGPNGAGKSTTIKAIVGIHLPTEGKIEVNGYDVAVQPVQAKGQIGFVPDHYALYENLTGREYLNYIADLYDVSIKDRDAFLDEFLDALTMKQAIDDKIQTYSHGMKQKIAIMASIIHNPKVWILDEPLTGLDPVSIFQVKQCLKKHAENGNIVFFSSHLIDIVEKLCDRIIIISDHKVVDIADVKELLAKGVNLEQYYMDKTGLATGN